MAERFYARLLNADPRISQLFARTDFARQRDLFLRGICSLLDFSDGKAAGRLAIERLGELHSRKRMNIAPEMFVIWVDCLMATLAELDPQFSPELEQRWRQALQPGIDRIKQLY